MQYSKSRKTAKRKTKQLKIEMKIKFKKYALNNKRGSNARISAGGMGLATS